MVPVALSRTIKADRGDENRIPSPIRNRLHRPTTSTHKVIQTIKANDRLKVNKTLPDLLRLEKEPEYQIDVNLITNKPKQITLIDKLQQLAYMTKPKTISRMSEVDNIDLKVEITLNEYIDELKSNKILLNDFR